MPRNRRTMYAQAAQARDRHAPLAPPSSWRRLAHVGIGSPAAACAQPSSTLLPHQPNRPAPPRGWTLSAAVRMAPPTAPRAGGRTETARRVGRAAGRGAGRRFAVRPRAGIVHRHARRPACVGIDPASSRRRRTQASTSFGYLKTGYQSNPPGSRYGMCLQEVSLL
ncbi:MAG: hypothetical protein ACLQU1_10065 [Bryobacteraceae bacterium]